MTSYKYVIKYCDLMGVTVSFDEIMITTATTSEQSFELALDYAKSKLKPHRMIEAVTLKGIFI